MDRRAKKIERVLSVQRQMHRLAEWNVATLERRKAELAASEVELVAALNADNALQGLFIEAMAHRLAALARETDQVNEAHRRMARKLTEAGLKLKRTERMSAKLHRDLEAALGRQEFADLLDLLGRPTDEASFP
jgi:transposase